MSSKAQERREAGAAAARERGQVGPEGLKKGHVYTIPSHGAQNIEIVSVGPKWIVWQVPTLRPDRPRRSRVLRSGWEGPYFLEVKPTRLATGLVLRGSVGGGVYVWAVTRCRHNKNGSCNTTLKTVVEQGGVGGTELKMEAEVTWPEGVVCGDWEVVL